MIYKNKTSRRRILRTISSSAVIGTIGTVSGSKEGNSTQIVETGIKHEIPTLNDDDIYPITRWSSSKPYTIENNEVYLLKPLKEQTKKSVKLQDSVIFADGLRDGKFDVSEMIGKSIPVEFGSCGIVESDLRTKNSYNLEDIIVRADGKYANISGSNKIIDGGEKSVNPGNTAKFSGPTQHVKIEAEKITGKVPEHDTIPKDQRANKRISKVKKIPVKPTVTVRNWGSLSIVDVSDEYISLGQDS